MTEAVIAAAVIVIGWFAVGSIVNVRKGHAAMRWLQGGLPVVGERTTVRWLGTTLVEMSIVKASGPFQAAVVVVFLEPRDVPWLWALSRRRGRRDTLIFRAHLRRPPSAELEVLDPSSWSGRDALRRMGGQRWSTREPASPADLTAYYKFQRSLETADVLVPLAGAGGLTLRRLALRPSEPHLQIHADLPDPSASAAEVFGALRSIGERAGGA
jgi:hypothetical protein